MKIKWLENSFLRSLARPRLGSDCSGFMGLPFPRSLSSFSFSVLRSLLDFSHATLHTIPSIWLYVADIRLAEEFAFIQCWWTTITHSDRTMGSNKDSSVLCRPPDSGTPNTLITVLIQRNESEGNECRNWFIVEKLEPSITWQSRVRETCWSCKLHEFVQIPTPRWPISVLRAVIK